MHNEVAAVTDPVSHISISGFHNVREIADHVDDAPTQAGLSGTRGRGVGALLLGAALGMAFMYLFDPDNGSWRRAMARDKARALLRRGSPHLSA